MDRVEKQLKKCMHELNLLREMISIDHSFEWYVDWEKSQVDIALIALDKMIPKEREEKCYYQL